MDTGWTPGLVTNNPQTSLLTLPQEISSEDLKSKNPAHLPPIFIMGLSIFTPLKLHFHILTDDDVQVLMRLENKEEQEAVNAPENSLNNMGRIIQ